MGIHLTQPEEVEQYLKTPEWRDVQEAKLPAAKKPSRSAVKADRGFDHGYISPYRAAYMKKHGFPE